MELLNMNKGNIKIDEGFFIVNKKPFITNERNTKEENEKILKNRLH